MIRQKSLLYKLYTRFMRLFFSLLYHSMAWTYDLVADIVSVGRWKHWVSTAAGLLHGPRVLELGFGPGHLQAKMHGTGIQAFGLDESMQMNRQTRRRLLGKKHTPRLSRGLAQNLPYSDGAFNSVVATFPTLYIVDPSTLSDIHRVLAPGGRLVVLLGAWITGKRPADRFAAWLFRATGQLPPEDKEIGGLMEEYTKAGFQAGLRFVDLPGSRVLFIIAKKP